jgi:hypothetical protein
MKKRIANFNEFVNEGYLQKIGSKISQWASSFMNAVKRGLVRLIPSGPKKGLPAFMYFSGEDGSIAEQVDNFYRGSKFYSMNNLNDPSTVTEAVVPLEYPVSDDVPNYSVDEIKKDIKRNMRAVLKAADAGDTEYVFTVKPYFIFGVPGIGKTQIVAQVCDELGQELGVGRLNMYNIDGEVAEPVDFAGVPKVVDIEPPSEENPYGKGVTRSNVNVDQLPTDNGDGNKGGIIFIDELNRMPETVIKIFMKLAQSRRVGQAYTIPSKWYIVAAGNRKDDDPKNGVIKDLSTAFRDRFEIVNYVPTVAAFRKHIETDSYKGQKLSNIVLPELLDFLDFQGEWFHKLDPAVKKAKFPTPRAWVDASFALSRVIEELQEEARAKGKELTVIPEKDIIREFTKNVGPEAANAFVSFYKISKTIPVKDLILPFTDPDNCPLAVTKGKSADYSHAFFGAVLRKSKEIELNVQQFCNWCKWLERNNDREFGAAQISSMVHLYPEILEDTPKMLCLSPLAKKFKADL